MPFASLERPRWFVSQVLAFPQPAIVMVEDGKDTVLRRPETFAHMTALDTAGA